MNSTMKMGTTGAILAMLISGCAPVPTASTVAGGTTTATTGTTTGPGTPVTTSGNTYDYGYGSTTGTGGSTTAGSGGSSYYDYGNTSGTSSSYDSYYTNTSGSNTGSGYNGYDYQPAPTTTNNSVSGSYAVQVVASPNRNTADAMLSQIRGMGYNAVIDNVGGLFKVRVPFRTSGEARSALSAIRSSVPDAFYTTR